jgi:hypothetical protein
MCLYNYWSTTAFDQTLFDNYATVARVSALAAIGAAVGANVIPAGL